MWLPTCLAGQAGDSNVGLPPRDATKVWRFGNVSGCESVGGKGVCLCELRVVRFPKNGRIGWWACPSSDGAQFSRGNSQKEIGSNVMSTADPSTQSTHLDAIFETAQLPALPQSAIRILEVTKDPENGPAELATPIEGDPGLASQVLKFVNSSYFGFSREISSVKLAITLVGVRTRSRISRCGARCSA